MHKKKRKQEKEGGREGEPMNIYESPSFSLPGPVSAHLRSTAQSKKREKRRIPPSAMIGIGAEGDLSSFRAGMEEPLWNERDGKRRTTLYMRGRDVVT